MEEEIKTETMKTEGIKINSNGEKPIFDKVTTMVITDAEFKLVSDLRKDKKNQDYKPFYLSVTYDFEGKPLYENYGGGRKYSEDNYWIGPKSALGKLKKKIDTTFDYDGTLNGLIKAIKNSQVGVLTEKTMYQDTVYPKNIIQHFK